MKSLSPRTTRRVSKAVRILFGIMALSPIAWAGYASLQSIETIFNVAPAQVRWRNYRDIFEHVNLARFIVNSCILTFSATLGAVFTSSLAGYAFARLHWRGRRLGILALLATMIFPLGVLIIPQFLVFQKLGWVNTYKPLIVPAWLGGSAFLILMFRQFFRSVPQAYEDAARLEGADDWQVYWHVMLPMARPAIGAAIALSAVFYWQDFLTPLLYLSDYRWYPVSVGLRMYHMMESSWGNLIMAASLVTMLPPLIVIFVAQRYLMGHIGARRD